MKKLVSTLLIACILASASIPAFAAESNTTNYSSAICCSATQFENLLKESVCIHLDDEELNIGSPVIDTQLVTGPSNYASSAEQNFISTIAIDVALIESQDEHGTLTVVPRANYTKEETGQSSSDIRIYTKIYWSTGEIYNAGADVAYVKLTQVSSTYQLLDTTCTLSNKCLKYGYGGYSLETSSFVDYESPWYATSSFSVTAPPLEATPGGMYFEIWGEAKCTMTRGNQTWDFSVQCFFTAYD